MLYIWLSLLWKPDRKIYLLYTNTVQFKRSPLNFLTLYIILIKIMENLWILHSNLLLINSEQMTQRSVENIKLQRKQLLQLCSALWNTNNISIKSDLWKSPCTGWAAGIKHELQPLKYRVSLKNNIHQVIFLF